MKFEREVFRRSVSNDNTLRNLYSESGTQNFIRIGNQQKDNYCGLFLEHVFSNITDSPGNRTISTKSSNYYSI